MSEIEDRIKGDLAADLLRDLYLAAEPPVDILQPGEPGSISYSDHYLAAEGVQELVDLYVEKAHEAGIYDTFFLLGAVLNRGPTSTCPA